jgi:hypothetical protein
VKKDKGFIQVIATDKQVASDIEQALLDQVMRELGAFLKDEAKPAKRRKAKKGGKQ